MYFRTLSAVILVSAAFSSFAQVAPEAKSLGIPLTVGVGYSNYATDWHGRLEGPSLWVDWYLNKGPALLQGFGLEAEARDLNYGRNTPNLRMDTAAGGPIYRWRHFNRFTPYAKFLVGYGSIDFVTSNPNYSHDTRDVLGPGGGAEYRALGNLWVRGNYEYQFWPDFFNHHDLNPTGFTVGVSYDMGGFRER